ncbi:MAG: cbb3-type cytochrome c oxidase subunit II [Opitutales bacterium]
MKSLPLIFCGIFFTLAFSWAGLVLASMLQWGDLEPYSPDDSGLSYPQAISGLAQQGKLIYQREGCMYCHSQQVRVQGYGLDAERGWGPRNTVARDYILQERVLLGTMRTGPDLSHIGGRIPGANWHYVHLWDPQFPDSHQNSIMPPFPNLFTVQEIGERPHPQALTLPDELRGEPYTRKPPPGYEVVPTKEAEALVAYLLSLRLTYELPEATLVE